MKIIAHRGASGEHPENSLAAFRAALEMGSKSVECDVRQTSDGALVLSHDPDIARLTGEKGEIGSMTLAELREACPNGLFPEFGPLIVLLPEDVELHIDVKQGDPPYPGFEERILETARKRRNWRARTTFSSADAGTLRRLKALDPELRLGFQPRAAPIDEAFSLAEELAVESLRIRGDRLTPEWVERAHAGGMGVYIYTVDDLDEVKRLRSLGVDAVFSNHPDIDRRRR